MGHLRSLLETRQGGDLHGFEGRRRRVLAAVLPLARVKSACWWRIGQHCECRVEFGKGGVVVVDVDLLPHSEGECWSIVVPRLWPQISVSSMFPSKFLLFHRIQR